MPEFIDQDLPVELIEIDKNVQSIFFISGSVGKKTEEDTKRWLVSTRLNPDVTVNSVDDFFFFFIILCFGR